MLLLILQSLWASFFPGHLVDCQVASGPWSLPLIHSVSTCNKSPSHTSVLCCVKALQHWLIGSWGWRWGLVLREEIFVSCFVFWSLRQSLKLEDTARGPHSLTITFHSSVCFSFLFFSPRFSTAWPRTGEVEILFEKERWQWRERIPAQLQASWWSWRRGHFTSLCLFP